MANQQPLAGEEELRKTAHDVCFEYANCYKSGYDAGRDGEPKDWSIMDKLAAKHEKVLNARIHQAINQKTTELAKAYGGCIVCYGKGYATQSSRAISRVGSWDTSGIKYCECSRGKQLEGVINQARIDEVESMGVLAVDHEEILSLLAKRLESLQPIQEKE